MSVPASLSRKQPRDVTTSLSDVTTQPLIVAESATPASLWDTQDGGLVFEVDSDEFDFCVLEEEEEEDDEVLSVSDTIYVDSLSLDWRDEEEAEDDETFVNDTLSSVSEDFSSSHVLCADGHVTHQPDYRMRLLGLVLVLLLARVGLATWQLVQLHDSGTRYNSPSFFVICEYIGSYKEPIIIFFDVQFTSHLFYS